MKPRGLLLLASAFAIFLYAGEKAFGPNRLDAHLFTPQQLDFTPALAKRLKVPPGFTVQPIATGLGKIRMMAAAPGGYIYITRPEAQDVLMFQYDPAARTVQPRPVLPKIKDVHGIAIHGKSVYLATIKQILVSQIGPSGTLGAPKMIAEDLPDGGQHPNRTIAIGPDDKLYVSVGSSCNSCVETEPEHATILQMSLEGAGRVVFAQGLRNTIGFAWHPETGQLWGMDHGSDWRGNDAPPEELNPIRQGSNYGWPFCFAGKQIDPYQSRPPKDKTREAFCAASIGPSLTYQAHSAPMAFVFYTASQFPPEYRNNAFVAMRGSWNRLPATGYSVARVQYENGKPLKIEEFLSGFLTDGGKSQFGRPVGLLVAPDGALLVTDDDNGVLYKISYKR